MAQAFRYVVSACLAGEACRYDGRANPNEAIISLVNQGLALPVCPETLGGLSVPRPPCELRGDRVVSHDGNDVTEAFHRGVEQAMRLVHAHGCTQAIVKSRSPSCGFGQVYDGNFSKRLIAGNGLWVEALIQASIPCTTEEAMTDSAKNDPVNTVWELRLQEVAKNLQERGFQVDVHPDMASAMAFFKKDILGALEEGASVSTGGSESIRLAGMNTLLREHASLTFLNPYGKTVTSVEDRTEVRRQALLADLYISSTNALLRDGRLLNLDGTGNRIAAMHFGPRKVVLFVGRNKICEDLEAARQRIKELAAPANCIRLERKTPCVKTGTCMECKSPDRICNVWALTEYSAPPKRIHVILVNEDLGY